MYLHWQICTKNIAYIFLFANGTRNWNLIGRPDQPVNINGISKRINCGQPPSFPLLWSEAKGLLRSQNVFYRNCSTLIISKRSFATLNMFYLQQFWYQLEAVGVVVVSRHGPLSALFTRCLISCSFMTVKQAGPLCTGLQSRVGVVFWSRLFAMDELRLRISHAEPVSRLDERCSELLFKPWLLKYIVSCI